ncbi:hypothetical protein [Streptomyces sp. MNP-20]|nr:hypothetical protein [Streptomyces sp. MNP-20]
MRRTAVDAKEDVVSQEAVATAFGLSPADAEFRLLRSLLAR